MKPTLSVLLLSSMLGCAGTTGPDDVSGLDDANQVDDVNPILGALDSSDISSVVRESRPSIKACYEAGLAIDPELSGRVEVKFIISPSGAVSKSEIKESTVDSVDVEDCMLDVMSNLQFPEPEGGGIVIVTFPFVLSE